MLANLLEFVPGDDAQLLWEIPAVPAVFLLRGTDTNSEPYITKTANARRRLQRLLGVPAEHSKKLNLRDRVRWIEFTPTGSDFESGFLLYRTLRAAFPKTYGDRLRFRFPPLVKLHLDNEYPRASITTRLGKLHGGNLYYGPFASRSAAEKFANDSLDFFKMRRCVDDLHPDPAFPGCIYSEMKMCLAPCFKGCSDADYHAEVSRVQTFFDTGGHSLLREISMQRDQASSDLAYEEASSHHARLEKLKPVLGQIPEIVRRIDRLAGLIIQPSAAPESVCFFRFDQGCLAGPLNFAIQSSEHTKSQSMEARVLQTLDTLAPAKCASANECMEHLAILRRWYYRGSRVGEIFFSDQKSELPLRRIVRGISRVYRGEKEDAGAPENSDSMRPS